jgi:small-conductance mechanosensitive channel
MLDQVFYGNTLRTILLALGAAALAYVALRLVRAGLMKSLKRISRRTSVHFDDYVVEVIRATRGWFLVVLALRAGSLVLSLPAHDRTLLGRLVALALLLQLAIWGRVAIRVYVSGHIAARVEEDAAIVTTMRTIGFLATVALWAVLLLMALGTLDIEIAPLIAGLGIGGVAVALAVQNILGDLFASLSIVLDKPFVYGDFINVGDYSGSVEHVGLKTTRLRSITGEQIVFSNSDLLQSRIRNYKRMQERRVVSAIGVVYGTDADTLKRIPGLLREIVEGQPDVRFDRAHFRDFGDSALNLEFVYHVLSPDYGLFMDRQQEINLEIFRRFNAEGIGFAYPTQTLFLAREAGGAVEKAEPTGDVEPTPRD